MEQASAFTPTVLERWRKRENLLPGITLVALAGAGWAYTIRQTTAMGTVEGMVMDGEGVILFLFGWTAMMAAMMVPATLPLILLYRTIARNRLSPARARVGMVLLLVGYVAVWSAVGLPVYGYDLVAVAVGTLSPLGALLPGLLLVAGGVYQFTGVKGSCHARCSNPLFFLLSKWRPGASGALRLGVLHGVDCLGCCAGLMVGLVALGMMNIAWMLTVAIVIFAEKTLPGSHRVARPLGVVMVAGGLVLVVTSLLGGMAPGMEPAM